MIFDDFYAVQGLIVCPENKSFWVESSVDDPRNQWILNFS